MPFTGLWRESCQESNSFDATPAYKGNGTVISDFRWAGFALPKGQVRHKEGGTTKTMHKTP